MLVVGATLLLAGCGRKADAPSPNTSAATPALTKIRFATDWYPQPEHGGYYHALVQGYFTDAGLDVEILPGSPRVTAEHRVASGEADFALSSSDQTLIACEHGLPLIALTTTLQHDPIAIMVRADSPVKSFADLSGRQVAVTPGILWFRYVAAKFALHDVREVPPTYNVANFVHDPAYIQQVFVTSEPFFARRQGVEARVLPVRDAGYDDYRVVVGQRDFVEKNPQGTRRFVAAGLRGWRDYLQSPDAAHGEILKLNPEMTPELAIYSWHALKDGHYVEGFADRGEAIGQMTAQRWQEQADILKQLGVLKPDADPRRAYTLDYQPGK